MEVWVCAVDNFFGNWGILGKLPLGTLYGEKMTDAHDVRRPRRIHFLWLAIACFVFALGVFFWAVGL